MSSHSRTFKRNRAIHGRVVPYSVVVTWGFDEPLQHPFLVVEIEPSEDERPFWSNLDSPHYPHQKWDDMIEECISDLAERDPFVLAVIPPELISEMGRTYGFIPPTLPPTGGVS